MTDARVCEKCGCHTCDIGWCRTSRCFECKKYSDMAGAPGVMKVNLLNNGTKQCPRCGATDKEVTEMANIKVIEVTCLMCNKKHTIMVPTAAYTRWAKGLAHIQDAMPHLSAEERELLMSGICPTCWDKTFG